MGEDRCLDLAGLVPAIVMPMRDDHSVDEPVLRRYVDSVASTGIKALAVNTDAGEGLHLSRDERRRVLDVTIDSVAGRVPVVAGLPAAYTEEAIALADDAKQAGADALLVFALPAFRGPSADEVVYAYHATLADAVGLPMILFQLQPELGGVDFSDDLLARLVAIDQTVAIKEASFDRRRMADTVEFLRGLDKQITILSGNDNFLHESLVLGAEGLLVGFGAIATGLQVDLVDAWRGGDSARASQLGERLQRLADVIFAPPVRDYRLRLKEALVVLGVFDRAVVRPPLLPIDDGERDRIRRALADAGLL